MAEGKEHRIEVLRKLPLLRDADPADLERIAERIERRSFQQGEELVREGAMGSSVYFIGSGRCEVKKLLGGKVERLAVLEPGDLFGEMAVVDPQSRSASVVAIEPVEAFILSAWEFREALHGSFRMTMQVLRVLAERLRRLEEELSAARAAAASPPPKPPRKKR